MRFRRRPSDGELSSWLETGQPARVERLLDDPDITERLERLTELPPETADELRDAVAPGEGFRDRTEHVVAGRVSDFERAGALFSLFGLGAQTVTALGADGDSAPSGEASDEEI